MIRELLIAATLAQASYYTPQEAQSLFAQGNDAYAREDYAGAREAYQKLLDHGFGGEDVLFNLGTASLAEGDLGAAVLYLERARRANGSSSDVEANLAVARSRQLDQVVGASLDEPLLERLVTATSATKVAWSFLVTWDLGLLLLLLRRLGWHRMAFTSGGLFTFVLAVAMGLLLTAHVYVRETVSQAVVIAQTLPARELPKDSAKASFEVHSGLKLRLLERSGKYVKVRLPNGLEGWTDLNGLAEI